MGLLAPLEDGDYQISIEVHSRSLIPVSLFYLGTVWKVTEIATVLEGSQNFYWRRTGFEKMEHVARSHGIDARRYRSKRIDINETLDLNQKATELVLKDSMMAGHTFSYLLPHLTWYS